MTIRVEYRRGLRITYRDEETTPLHVVKATSPTIAGRMRNMQLFLPHAGRTCPTCGEDYTPKNLRTRGHLAPRRSHLPLRFWIYQCRRCNNAQGDLYLSEWHSRLVLHGKTGQAEVVARTIAAIVATNKVRVSEM